MPIEIKILGYAAMLQFVQYILMAIPVNIQMGIAYTGGNRDEQRRPTGIPGRIKRALDNHFEGLCKALECEQLLEREGMRNVVERITDFGPWLDAIEEEIAKWSTDELLARFDANGVPFGKVKTIREFAEDPQARHNRTIFDAEHPELGTLRYVRYPGHLSETPASLVRHPPRLGEHSAEILAEAGYNEEQVASLKEAGIIA